MRLLVLLTAALAMSTILPVQAATEPASSKTMTFFGRWDLRTEGKAITVNSGSYVRVMFEGNAVTALFDTTDNKDPFPTLAWKIDNGSWHEDNVAASVNLAGRLVDGPHSLWLMVRALDEHQNRWTAPRVASVTFLGLDLAGGKLLPPLDAWLNPKLKIEFLGDSITEGVLVGGSSKGGSWAWQSNALLSYSAQTAMKLGAEWRQVGFGATGIAHGGSGHAPAAQDGFNFFYDGCPRDDWQPDLVVINQGTNDGGAGPEFVDIYAKYLTTIRQAYPNARIVALRPFFGMQEAHIKSAVESVQAKGDKNLFYMDTTGWYPTGNLHPDWKSAVGISDKFAAALTALPPFANRSAPLLREAR